MGFMPIFVVGQRWMSETEPELGLGIVHEAPALGTFVRNSLLGVLLYILSRSYNALLPLLYIPALHIVASGCIVMLFPAESGNTGLSGGCTMGKEPVYRCVFHGRRFGTAVCMSLTAVSNVSTC